MTVSPSTLLSTSHGGVKIMADHMATSEPDRLALPSLAYRVLRWLRVGWLVLAVFLFAVFLISIPGTYMMLQTPCPLPVSTCQNPWQATVVEQIVQAGISLQPSALYLVILYTSVSVVFWAVGILILIYRYRADNWFALLTAHLMVLLAVGGPSLIFTLGLYFSSVPYLIPNLIAQLTLPVYQFISLFLLVFPNGRFYGRWNWLPFSLICLNTFFWITGSATLNIGSWPPALGNLWILIVFCSHLIVQIVRYRYMYTPIERQQAKWLIYGFGVGIAVISLPNLIVPNLSQHPLVSASLLPLLYLPLGLAVGIAILRYRLWDIDIIINRTLVYGSLTAIVVGVYIVVVGTLSAIFQSNGSLLISLLATGIVAVSFQSLRERLQRVVDRFIYGERNDPYAVISRLSERLETITSPGTLLPGITETVALAMNLPYVAVNLKVENGVKTHAVYGQPVDRGHITILQLMYGQESVGQMVIGQTAGDKALDHIERQLLENIARQTGIAAHAVQLSIALQHSRQQIITAREEERRRLRRDLHDGLGPALAAHTIKVGTARSLIESNPQTASSILAELETNLANSLTDIRRLVYNLRPPALDQLGLVGALDDFMQQYNQTESQYAVLFTFQAPEHMPILPAAVEVASYRIVQEAVNNVLRHAHAHHCLVQLEINDSLVITVTDDGIGLPARLSYGVGLNSMRERSEELGGGFKIENQASGGTSMQVWLPSHSGQAKTDSDGQ
jgi:signal transduction histidine kinase